MSREQITSERRETTETETSVENNNVRGTSEHGAAVTKAADVKLDEIDEVLEASAEEADAIAKLMADIDAMFEGINAEEEVANFRQRGGQ